MYLKSHKSKWKISCTFDQTYLKKEALLIVILTFQQKIIQFYYLLDLYNRFNVEKFKVQICFLIYNTIIEQKKQ